MADIKDRVKKLSQEKDYTKIVELTENIGTTVDELVLHFSRGEALFRLGREKEALKSFQLCIHYDLTRMSTKRRFFNAARYAQRILKDDAEANVAFWRECADSKSKTLELAADAFLAADYHNASTLFSETVTELFGESETSENWIRSFEDLIAIDRDGAVFDDISVPSVRKIFLCGIGWSGSSALRDYVREFPRVLYLGGKSEYRYIEDDMSLLDVYYAILEGQSWKRKFLNFYFGGILGFSCATSYSSFKSILGARRLCFESVDGAVKLSRAVKIVIRNSSRFFNSEDNRRTDLFLIFARDFVNLISSGAYLEDADFYVLDNAVHIRTLDSVHFIDNAIFFPTFRDPRSMQVSRQVENKTYSKGASAYVKTFKRKVAESKTKISSFIDKIEDDNVECLPVQFERFVMDEAYREGLAREMGLDFSGQQKHTTFKPWESARNVFIHETHGDPEEIALIERELPEHLVDLDIYRDERARLEKIAQEQTD